MRTGNLPLLQSPRNSGKPTPARRVPNESVTRPQGRYLGRVWKMGANHEGSSQGPYVSRVWMRGIQ